jgi:hypothetical protein
MSVERSKREITTLSCLSQFQKFNLEQSVGAALQKLIQRVTRHKSRVTYIFVTADVFFVWRVFLCGSHGPLQADLVRSFSIFAGETVSCRFVPR